MSNQSPDLMDLSDSLSRKTAQLEAIVLLAGTEAFGEFSVDIKSNYLWLCGDLTTQIRDEFDGYDGLARSQKSTGGAK